MNRVVYPFAQTSRTGIGLCKAVIGAVDCAPAAPDDEDITGPPDGTPGNT